MLSPVADHEAYLDTTFICYVSVSVPWIGRTFRQSDIENNQNVDCSMPIFLEVLGLHASHGITSPQTPPDEDIHDMYTLYEIDPDVPRFMNWNVPSFPFSLFSFPFARRLSSQPQETPVDSRPVCAVGFSGGYSAKPIVDRVYLQPHGPMVNLRARKKDFEEAKGREFALEMRNGQIAFWK